MGLFEKTFSHSDEEQEDPGLHGDATRWRTIDGNHTDTTRDPDIMYIGRPFRIPEA